MARSDAGAALTRTHRRQQLALRASVVREVLVLSKLWNSPFDDFADATATLVSSRRRDSAAISSRYYRAFRVAEGPGGVSTPVLGAQVERGRVLASIYATGLGSYERGIAAGLTQEAARRNALVAVTGSAARHVLNGGRETILRSTRTDKQARGWQRITAGEPCAFCQMLASRGPAFKSQRTASFSAHDHCVCTAEPVYRGGEWTPQATGFRRRWNEATAGLSGKDALAAFRRAM